MNLIRYDDVHQFYQVAHEYLTKREAQNNLILGLTATLLEDPFAYGDEPPYMAVINDNQKIVGVVLRTPPHPLHISYLEDETVLSLVADDVIQKFGRLSGVGGVVPFSTHFVEKWQSLTGQTIRKQMSLRIYQLTRVNPVQGVAGSMRLATEKDRALLLDWTKRFELDTVSAELSDEQAARSVDRAFHDSTKRVFIWEDGEPVSMVATTGPTPNGIRIGSVYTPPMHRRKGYASACVAEASQLMLNQGRTYCFLFTDLENPTSNHIYQVIGYEAVCDVGTFIFND